MSQPFLNTKVSPLGMRVNICLSFEGVCVTTVILAPGVRRRGVRADIFDTTSTLALSALSALSAVSAVSAVSVS